MRYFAFLLTLFSVSCVTNSQSKPINYPSINKVAVTDVYHGLSVTDDYRNLEDLQDSTVRNWFNKQGALTNSIFDTISVINELKRKFKDIDNRTETWAKNLKQDEIGNLYYLKRPIGEYVFKVFKKDVNGEVMELFSPSEFRPEDQKNYEINYLQPSWNGRYLVLSINTRGSFSSEIVILDLSSEKLLDYTISNVAPNLFHGVQWLPSNDAFTYLFFPVVDKTKKGYKINSESVLHRVGQKNSRIPIFGNETGIKMDPTFFPVTKISSSKNNYIIGYVANVDRFHDAYYSDIKSLESGRPKWKKLYSIEDKVLYNEGILRGNRYYYISPKFRNNYQILSVDMNNINFKNPTVESVAPSEEVVNDFSLDSDGLYYTSTKNGVDVSLHYLSKDKKSSEIEMPFEVGNIVLSPNSLVDKGIHIECDGWSVDLMRYLVIGTEIKDQVVLAKIPEFPEFKSIKVEELEVKSHDGKMVPVSLIYDSRRPRNGNLPTMIVSYGAYGSNQSPYFSPLRLAWIARGGVISIAHIRGGGEKGEDWHKEGQKANKSNSWKDIISVTEYLIKEGITSEEKTILYSRSAGAISSGMAMINRPDLFKVFVSRVPFINPSRSSAGSYKKSSYLEFGDIENPQEAKFLLGMDPYLNLKRNVNYPAAMISPSAKDDRLDLWESGKFIARLQEYSTSGLPILLDVDLNSGHSKSSTETIAKIFGFATWVVED